MFQKIPVSFGLAYFKPDTCAQLLLTVHTSSKVVGFSQSILTVNTISWLLPLIFQLCADRIGSRSPDEGLGRAVSELLL